MKLFIHSHTSMVKPRSLEWIINFISFFIGLVVIYPCWDLKSINVSKRGILLRFSATASATMKLIGVDCSNSWIGWDWTISVELRWFSTWGVGLIFYKQVRANYWNLFVLILLLIIQSDHNFAHKTTTRLSPYGQHCYRMDWTEFV